MTQKMQKGPGSRAKLDALLASRQNRWIIIALFGLAELCLVIAIVVVVIRLGLVKPPDPFAFIVPVDPTPTPACLRPVIDIGSTSFPIQIIQRAGDGSVVIPAGGPEQAFWVDGNHSNFIFGLSPSPAALALQGTLKAGSRIRIVWEDCSMNDFLVNQVRAGQPQPAELLAAPKDGVRVFVQKSAAGDGFVIEGMNPLAVSAATAVCNSPALEVGSHKYKLQVVAPAKDGKYTVKASSANIAYWFKGAAAEYVFALSPSAQNLALAASVHAGDLVSITDAHCQATSYTLAAPEPGKSYIPARAAQPAPGMILFIQNAPKGKGFVLRGGPLIEQAIPTATTAPEGPGVQAEISLLETITPADKSKLQIRVSVYNTGSSAFNLTANDVRLTPQGGEALKPMESEPALPFKVGPGATQAFLLTFARPEAGTAVLKIFDTEYDIEGY